MADDAALAGPGQPAVAAVRLPDKAGRGKPCKVAGPGYHIAVIAMTGHHGRRA